MSTARFKPTPISAAAALAIAGVGLIGCETPPDDPSIQMADGTVAWQPQVTTVRIHPATRYRMRDGQAVLEARVELDDQMGDPMKASAGFAFELSTAGDTPGSAPETLYRWDERVATLDEQSARYDAVTRAYVFPLTLNNFDAALRSTRLRVAVTLPDGRTLLDAAPLVVLQPSE
ncbi:MAG: hypothetical protein AAF078_09065 [Planctomycetota bacterium]